MYGDFILNGKFSRQLPSFSIAITYKYGLLFALATQEDSVETSGIISRVLRALVWSETESSVFEHMKSTRPNSKEGTMLHLLWLVWVGSVLLASDLRHSPHFVAVQN